MTIEEAKANLASALELYERRMQFGHRGRAFTTDDLRTLLASHASLTAYLAEAKRLMKPFVKLHVSQLHGTPHVLIDGERRSMSLTMQEHLRALAAFYNKGEE